MSLGFLQSFIWNHAQKAAINILKEKYESMINAELGYIIMILDAKVDEMGKMISWRWRNIP